MIHRGRVGCDQEGRCIGMVGKFFPLSYSRQIRSVSNILCAGLFAVLFRMLIRCLLFALSNAVLTGLSGWFPEPGIPCGSRADAACPGFLLVLSFPGELTDFSSVI